MQQDATDAVDEQRRPRDIGAEQQVLGAMILSGRAAAEVAELVSREDFYRLFHQDVYDCVTAMRRDGVPVDAGTVARELGKAGKFAGDYQAPYVHTLTAECLSSASGTYYARTVADLASRRRSLEQLERAHQRLAGGADLAEVVEAVTLELEVEQRLAAEGGGSPSWASSLVEGGGFVLDVPSTPPAVWGDGESVGWAEGESMMIVGPPGVGKTTLVVQLVAGRLGIGKDVLGLPVRPGARRVLYLAMDRPPQIARAMGRLFGEEHRELLAERLAVWKGPPPADFARNTELLAEMCRQADADTVVVDSLKDGVLKCSDDEAGSGYNRARQRTLVDGVQVVELHHQRKANGDNKKPSKLDDVYGSVWLTAGAGSVVVLWGQAGDPVVELTHLKQPMEPLGPWQIRHDHDAGTSTIYHQADLLQVTLLQGSAGLTPQVAARALFSTDKPTPSEVEKARRRLDRYVSDGLLVRRAGQRGGGTARASAAYFLAAAERDGRGA